jgi:hypothetical protein
MQGKLGYDTIIGTIVSNAAKNISSATVHAALYDKNNTLITMESGLVSVSLLNPGGKSPFAIDIFGVKDVISSRNPIILYIMIVFRWNDIRPNAGYSS